MKRSLMPIVAAAASLWMAAAVPALADGLPERVILNPTQDPSTSQNVTWRAVGVSADLPGHVELRLPNGEVQTVDASVTKVMALDDADAVTYAATLTDLGPTTTYTYRVLVGELASDWYDFTTAAADDAPFTFTWYADGQNELTEKWTPIVRLGAQAFPDSIVTLQTGDLIDWSVEEQWAEWFAVTDGERQTENWMPSLGNHEYSQDPFADFWDASFTVAHNGPAVPEDAGSQTRPYQELMANHLRNQTYYVDLQGVRFVNLNVNLPSQAVMEAEQGVDLPDLPELDWLLLYADLNVRWLDRVLGEFDGNWTVVQFHQPVFSVSVGRDNPEVRMLLLPVLQAHNVDLVLNAHDHTYARGYYNADATETPGVTSGPVYIGSNSGPKYYELPPADDNVWTRNGATQVARHAQISLIHAFRVTPETISYEAIVAQKGENPTSDLAIGETLDSFTITRHADGSKSVTEGIDGRVATGL